jgi:hypothetical protein
MRRVKEGDYGRGTLCTCMNIETVKVISRRGVGKRETNGGNEPNPSGCICVCHSQPPCTTITHYI